jgi:hypothetical protein
MAADNTPDEPLLDIARGNAAVSRYLHQSLRALRDNNEDPHLRLIIEDVLAGRTSLRAAFTNPQFTAGLEPGIERFSQVYEGLDPQERARFAAEGEELLRDAPADG